MFLSWQTYEGLQISAYSAVEATTFLLIEGEEYFGNQRKLGRRNDNPDMKMFGYNNKTIRVQRAVSCQSGNMHTWKERPRQIMGQCFGWPSAKEEETMTALYIGQFYNIKAKSLYRHWQSETCVCIFFSINHVKRGGAFAKENEPTLTYSCMMLCKTSLATLLLIISSELENMELYAETISTSWTDIDMIWH